MSRNDCGDQNPNDGTGLDTDDRHHRRAYSDPETLERGDGFAISTGDYVTKPINLELTPGASTLRFRLTHAQARELGEALLSAADAEEGFDYE